MGVNDTYIKSDVTYINPLSFDLSMDVLFKLVSDVELSMSQTTMFGAVCIGDFDWSDIYSEAKLYC